MTFVTCECVVAYGLVRWTPEQVVRVQVFVAIFCFWVRHLTLMVALYTQNGSKIARTTRTK